MIFFECYADEALLRFVGFSSRELKGGHSFGRSNVCLKLKKTGRSVGLIDEDPNATQDAYLKQLYLLRPNYVDSYLIHIVDEALENRLLILRPNLEGFIVKIARERKIDLKDFNLSDNVRELHDWLRLQNNATGRGHLIKFVQAHQDHSAIKKLKQFIKPI